MSIPTPRKCKSHPRAALALRPGVGYNDKASRGFPLLWRPFLRIRGRGVTSTPSLPCILFFCRCPVASLYGSGKYFARLSARIGRGADLVFLHLLFFRLYLYKSVFLALLFFISYKTSPGPFPVFQQKLPIFFPLAFGAGKIQGRGKGFLFINNRPRTSKISAFPADLLDLIESNLDGL